MFEGSRWSIIAAIKAVIWEVWASAAEEKALVSSEIPNVDAVAREGGRETSSDVMPWNLEENTEDPVVSAVPRRYFLALYMKKVKSAQEDWVVCSA